MQRIYFPMSIPVRTYRTRILAWYRATARDFPWRNLHVSPYHVLVSEFMLQQTQAARVAELMPLFLESFPTIFDLARASNADVLVRWKGLGYNSRAIRLRDAAKSIVELYQGEVPASSAVLRTLPGLGPYASASVTCFAYNTPVVVIDVNVRRVFSRWLDSQPTTASVEPPSAIEAFAAEILPRKNPAEWYHAVMDFGATVCTARNPKCSTCVVHAQCPSAFVMQPATRKAAVERLHRGHPSRIWRGRIVELLRTYRQGLHTEAMLSMLIGDADENDRPWFARLLHGLQRDSMIEQTDDIVRLHDA